MTDKAIAIDGGSPQFYAQTSQDMPLFYDQGLGPVYFVDFAEDIARRTAAFEPLRVLEIAPAPALSVAACAISYWLRRTLS